MRRRVGAAARHPPHVVAPPATPPPTAATAFVTPTASVTTTGWRAAWRPRGFPAARRAARGCRLPSVLTMGAARAAAAGAGGQVAPTAPPSLCPPTTLITWNVASLRALLRKHPSALEDLTKLQASHEATIPALPGYTAHFASSGPPAARGYAGVAMYVRDSLAGDTVVTAGVGWAPADAEGRCLTARLPGGRPAVVGVYAPNAGVGLKRLAFRMDWDAALAAHVAAVRDEPGGAGVVLVGDLNVAPDVVLDVWGGPSKGRVAGLTAEERAGFATLLAGEGSRGGSPDRIHGSDDKDGINGSDDDGGGGGSGSGGGGLIDVYRARRPRGSAYTHWSYRGAYRPGDGGDGTARGGWRLDYALVDERVWVAGGGDAWGVYTVPGSDHVPVVVTLGGGGGETGHGGGV
ncbi:hypothetical protein MMPV_004913 [Pyropia vietnamensis]